MCLYAVVSHCGRNAADRLRRVFFLTAVLGVALVGFVWRRSLMFFLAVGGELLEHLLLTASQIGVGSFASDGWREPFSSCNCARSTPAAGVAPVWLPWASRRSIALPVSYLGALDFRISFC